MLGSHAVRDLRANRVSKASWLITVEASLEGGQFVNSIRTGFVAENPYGSVEGYNIQSFSQRWEYIEDHKNVLTMRVKIIYLNICLDPFGKSPSQALMSAPTNHGIKYCTHEPTVA